jgi:putative SOS response-associated peptidase YedK
MLAASPYQETTMCGRYAITLPPEAVRAFFAYVENPNFPPRYNIAPTQPIPVVTAGAHSAGRERHFVLVRWGFLPGFVKDPKAFPLLINARAETVAEKASFRAALQRRRCVVIADGFYEWRKETARGPKTPYLIRRVDRQPMGFAGLGETWSDPSGGEIDTACIITVAANRLMSFVHDRMPAIVPHESFAAWLDNDGVDVASALRLLQPAPEKELELVPIGSEVNRAANDDLVVQTPVGEAIRAAQPAKAR